MLRDPPQRGNHEEIRRGGKKRRFQIVKLEERIVPRHSKGHYPGPPYGVGRCYNPTDRDGC